MARPKTDAEYRSEAFWTFGAPLLLFVLVGAMAVTGRRQRNPAPTPGKAYGMGLFVGVLLGAGALALVYATNTSGTADLLKTTAGRKKVGTFGKTALGSAGIAVAAFTLASRRE